MPGGHTQAGELRGHPKPPGSAGCCKPSQWPPLPDPGNPGVSALPQPARCELLCFAAAVPMHGVVRTRHGEKGEDLVTHSASNSV